MASTADAAGGATAVEHLGDSDGLVPHELGVAVVTASADQAAGLVQAAEGAGPIAAVEPERVVRAIESMAVVAEPEPPQSVQPRASACWRRARLSPGLAGSETPSPAGRV